MNKLKDMEIELDKMVSDLDSTNMEFYERVNKAMDKLSENDGTIINLLEGKDNKKEIMDNAIKAKANQIHECMKEILYSMDSEGKVFKNIDQLFELFDTIFSKTKDLDDNDIIEIVTDLVELDDNDKIYFMRKVIEEFEKVFNDFKLTQIK